MQHKSELSKSILILVYLKYIHRHLRTYAFCTRIYVNKLKALPIYSRFGHLISGYFSQPHFKWLHTKRMELFGFSILLFHLSRSLLPFNSVSGHTEISLRIDTYTQMSWAEANRYCLIARFPNNWNSLALILRQMVKFHPLSLCLSLSCKYIPSPLPIVLKKSHQLQSKHNIIRFSFFSGVFSFFLEILL